MPVELTQLSLMNFRCFERRDFEFCAPTTFIVGPNAVGKTSVLEAVCVLLRLQSPRVSTLGRIVRHGAPGFSVQGRYEGKRMQFYFGSRRKKLALDGVEQSDSKEYLRLARLVYFGNPDLEIAAGAGEARRRFLDFAGSQQHAQYRVAWRQYQRALRARNALLKRPPVRRAEVESFDGPLAETGVELLRFRKELVERLNEHAGWTHAEISGGAEQLALEYRPACSEDFAAELRAAFGDDLRYRTTTTGPHRDDLRFLLGGVDTQDFASEGQQRTLVLALKLAHARLLDHLFGRPPLLLLDDVFGELDPARRNALLNALPKNAQRLITTTFLDWSATAADEQEVCRL